MEQEQIIGQLEAGLYNNNEADECIKVRDVLTLPDSNNNKVL